MDKQVIPEDAVELTMNWKKKLPWLTILAALLCVIWLVVSMTHYGLLRFLLSGRGDISTVHKRVVGMVLWKERSAVGSGFLDEMVSRYMIYIVTETGEFTAFMDGDDSAEGKLNSADFYTFIQNGAVYEFVVKGERDFRRSYFPNILQATLLEGCETTDRIMAWLQERDITMQQVMEPKADPR